MVKLIQSVIPGNFVKVLENSIQKIVEAEVRMVLGANPYQRSSEAYFAGVSTYKMNKLFMDVGLENIERSFVSRCAA